MLRVAVLCFWLVGLSLGMTESLRAQQKQARKKPELDKLQGIWKTKREVKDKDGVTIKTEIILHLKDETLGIQLVRQKIKVTKTEVSIDRTGSGIGSNRVA